MKARSAVAVLMAAITVMAAAQLPYKPKFAGDPAKSNSEAAALGYMRTVIMAERLYKQKHGHYAGDLSALVGSGSFTRRMVRTDRGDYTVTFHGGGSGFSLALTPKEFASDRRAFYVDQSGTFRVETQQAATAESPVLKPE